MKKFVNYIFALFVIANLIALIEIWVMKILGLIIFLFVSFSSLASDYDAVVDNTLTCSEQMTELLNQYPNTAVVHVKGLVCDSCGIGIRIGLAKVDGVDKSKFTKGVLLDSSNQYVVIANGQSVDFKIIFQKIHDAGYDPMHLCYIEQGNITRVKANKTNS